MTRIRWTQRALRNLRQAHRFLAAENPAAARRAIEAIQTNVRMLETFPEIGRPVTHLGTGFREWQIQFAAGAYIVRYRTEGEAVILLALRHSRQGDFLP